MLKFWVRALDILNSTYVQVLRMKTFDVFWYRSWNYNEIIIREL